MRRIEVLLYENDCNSCLDALSMINKAMREHKKITIYLNPDTWGYHICATKIGNRDHEV